MMVNGFILDNQLTDFSFEPELDGKPVANAAGPGKHRCPRCRRRSF